MVIVAPVSSVHEVEMLIDNGADELYCGLNPPEWEARVGARWWINRRSPAHASFNSFDDLRETIRRAHRSKVPVYLTVNAPFYPGSAVPYLLDLSQRLVYELEVDGLIVSDLNFLLSLARLDLPASIHLSSLGGCYNRHTVEFYSGLGVRRIILSRQLRRSEIERIVKGAPSGVAFEVFGLNDGCYFEEGYCQASHTLGPFCLSQWEEAAPWTAKGHISSEDLECDREQLRKYLWFQDNCGSSFQKNGLPNGPCSLCWLGQFRDWGVHGVKIVGREASFHRKMASLQLVKAVMDLVRKGGTSEEVSQSALSFRATPELCDTRYMCYYGDA